MVCNIGVIAGLYRVGFLIGKKHKVTIVELTGISE